MKTHYRYSVSKDASGSCIVSGADTLSDALKEAVTYATYYKGIYPGERITVTVETVCAVCDGVGTVHRANAPTDYRQIRTKHFKRCPECKGTGGREELARFPFVIHENTVQDQARNQEKALKESYEKGYSDAYDEHKEAGCFI